VSSSSVHRFFWISGLRWLCHLIIDILGDLDLPLTALLANPSLKKLGNLTPILGLKLVDLLDKDSILLLSPRTLLHFGVQHLLPPVQALNIGPVLESLGYLLPVARLNVFS